MIKIFPQSNSLEFTQQLVKCNAGYELGKIHKTKFANGEITVVIEESVRNEAIVIVSQAKTYEDMFELFETIDAARRSSAKEIIGIIPYLPHSRQERREEGVRTTISARLFADMLQTAGLDRLITMDVHTTAIEGFYKIPFDNLDPFTTIIDKIKNLVLVNPTIVSPDLGGMKRAEKYASALGYNIAFINKKRLKVNEVDKMTLIGSVKDSDVIIVDDLIDTGGTIIKAIDLLKKDGANTVHVFATHGLFSNKAMFRFATCEHNPELYTTNTLPYEGINNFDFYTEINVIGEFYKALKKIFSS
jgi:ribose-phosphate pyrophosphokinase